MSFIEWADEERVKRHRGTEKDDERRSRRSEKKKKEKKSHKHHRSSSCNNTSLIVSQEPLIVCLLSPVKFDVFTASYVRFIAL